jgi:hypothetical protein
MDNTTTSYKPYPKGATPRARYKHHSKWCCTLSGWCLGGGLGSLIREQRVSWRWSCAGFWYLKCIHYKQRKNSNIKYEPGCQIVQTIKLENLHDVNNYTWWHSGIKWHSGTGGYIKMTMWYYRYFSWWNSGMKWINRILIARPSSSHYLQGNIQN